MDENMTIEQARAEIVRLTEANTALTCERDTLSQNNTDLSAELENVRTLNQSLFQKLIAQNVDPEGKPEPEDNPPLSCEDFARTLKF